MKTDNQQLSYVGRFAPSPTGPLHFGSLVAAMASFLDARANGGTWIVRMEDLDPPREQPGAAAVIISTLEQFGFNWDGPVEYQSRRISVYQNIIEELLKSGDAFWCACSRRHLKGHRIYPGTCEDGLAEGQHRRSVRVKVKNIVEFEDRVQGHQRHDLAEDVGAFIIRRADGLIAYQIAVVIDDAWQGITRVVRGCDLLDSTPRQIYLQRLLGLPIPQYAHIPIAVDGAAKKLSKQTFAMPVDPSLPLPALRAAAKFLGQNPDVNSARTVDQFWSQAVDQWHLESIPSAASIPASGE